MGSTYREDLKELLTSAIGALKRVRQFVFPSTLQTMYNFFIKLYFDYCSVVWEGLGSEPALTLQKLQNRAASQDHSLFQSSYDSSSGPLLQELGWDNFSVPRIKLFAIKWRCTFIMAPSVNTYAQTFWKWGPIMILGAPFLDFYCLFPKPIMAKTRSSIYFEWTTRGFAIDLNLNWTDCSPASSIPYYNPSLELIYQRLISSFTNIYFSPN